LWIGNILNNKDEHVIIWSVSYFANLTSWRWFCFQKLAIKSELFLNIIIFGNVALRNSWVVRWNEIRLVIKKHSIILSIKFIFWRILRLRIILCSIKGSLLDFINEINIVFNHIQLWQIWVVIVLFKYYFT
jgi:hypothetical protein